MRPEISVIVCTIGRQSLRRALASLKFEQHLIGEVLIIDDSKDGLDQFQLPGLPVEIIRTTGLEGIAKARQIGIRNSKFPWIAFLDDDDVWLQSKLEMQYYEIMTLDLDFSLTSALTLDVNSNYSKQRPVKNLLIGKSPFSALYSNPHIFFSKYFLPTSSFLLKKSLAEKVLSEETPDERENLFMLQRSFELGARISQSSFIGVGVFEDKHRSLRRINFSSETLWYGEVAERSKRYAFSFAIESIRNFARARKFKEAVNFSKFVLTSYIKSAH